MIPLPQTLERKSATAIDYEFIDPTADSRWDEWIQKHPAYGVFHTAAWARVLKETYGFAPLYLRLAARSGTTLLLPFFEVDSWLTKRRGISLPFSDECRPLGDLSLLTPAWNLLRDHGVARRWRYVELRCGTAQLSGASPSATYYTHHLDLTPGCTTLFQRFDPAVRRAIRKAQRSDLTVEFTHTESALREYFRLHELTRRRHGLPPQPYAFFESVRRHILAADLGFLVLVRRGSTAVAGTMFFHRGPHALFKFGASDQSHQALRPVNLALWSAIQRVADRGCTHLHFGRNAVFHESLRRFKLSWGTTEAQLDYTQFNLATGKFMTEPSLLQGWQNRIFRSLPLPLSRVAGRLLYRHIA